MSHASWFLPTSPSDRPVQLYCFSYAGGNAAAYLGWQADLPAHIEVRGVQLPGRGVRFGEPPITDMTALIDQLAPAFQRMADRPFAFFGHSLGALVAFELARRLAASSARQPSHLLLSGCHAPRHRRASRNYHQLNDRALLDVLRDYGGTPPEILAQGELMALLLPTIRADFALAETYRPEPRPALRIPLHVLAGREDEHEDPVQVHGWSAETAGPTQCHWFDGGHFFIDEHRAAVLRLIGDVLGEASGSRSGRAVA